MPDIAQCSECGSALPAYWPKGLCSHCALAGMLEDSAPTDPLGAGEEPASAPSRPFRFGDYHILEEVARGGMGVIYRARQVSLNRVVALKMILAGQFASKQEVLRFRSEAEAAANLQHPNIVRIHETGECEGRHYFSMDYIEGRTLAETARGHPLPAQRAAIYGRIIAEAIHYAHSQGVLHRDLKPSNVVIDANDQPRITDFGLAKSARGDFGVTVTGQVIGSPNFMPPEQTSAKAGKVGPWSDVYGIGAILYYLLTDRPPFQAETMEEVLLLLRDSDPVSPRLLNPSVPLDLETICLRCLEKDPARRYATAQELADELGRFLRDEPIEARPLGSINKLWRWCRRRPLIAALSASVVLLLLAMTLGSAFAAWRVNRARGGEQAAIRDLRHSVNLLELERAEDFFTADDSAAGLAHLASILRRDPSNAIAANRLVSALVHRDWAVAAAPAMRHAGRVARGRFSPDGRKVLSASWDRTAGVWDASTGHRELSLEHPDRVILADYSPQGDRILTTGASHPPCIWTAATGELQRRLPHEGRVYWSEFSADGRWILTASTDGVRIWNASNGALRKIFRGHASHVTLARFSADGQRVASGGSHGSVRLWNVSSGKMLFHLEDRDKPLTALAFSPDGRRLISACDDGIARLWDADAGKPIGEPMVHPGQKPIWCATFSPDSKLALTTAEDGTAQLWDAETSRPHGQPMRHDSGIIYGEFSGDGKKLVTTSSDNTARVWEVSTGNTLCQPLRHLERVLHAAFSPDGQRLVTLSYDGLAQVWELRERIDAGAPIRHDLEVAPLAFSADGAAVLTVARDKTACLWDPRTGLARTGFMRHPSIAVSGDLTPDGTRVVLGCADGSIRIWDCHGWRTGGAATPATLSKPSPHQKKVRWTEFNPDGSRFVTASADGTARIWDTLTGQPLTASLIHRAEVVTAHFSRDGRQVVTASEDWTARVWNAQTGQPVTAPLAHLDHVKWAEFSPDGRRVVTASADNTAQIWEVATGRPIGPAFHHSRTVERAVFSPDGQRVATASLDRTALIWDANTGQALTPPLRHDSTVETVWFSQDGHQIATTCRNGLARFWDAHTGRPLTEWLGGKSYWHACYARNLDRVAMGGKDGVLRSWKMPQAPLPVPAWFQGFAEAMAGFRLGLRGSYELVEREQLQEIATSIPTHERTNFYGQVALQLLKRSGTAAAASR